MRFKISKSNPLDSRVPNGRNLSKPFSPLSSVISLRKNCSLFSHFKSLPPFFYILILMATSSVPKTPKSATFQALSKLHLSKLASKVRVLLRIRPLLASEIAAKDKIPIPCISVLNPDRDSSQEVTVHIKDQETR